MGYGTVGSNDLNRAKVFHDALVGSVGITPVLEHRSGGHAYGSTHESLFFGVLPI